VNFSGSPVHAEKIGVTGGKFPDDLENSDPEKSGAFNPDPPGNSAINRRNPDLSGKTGCGNIRSFSSGFN